MYSLKTYLWYYYYFITQHLVSMTNTDVAGGSLYQSMWMFKSNVCAGSPTHLLFSRVRHVCVELLKNQRNDLCILENVYTVATSYLISRQRIYLPYKWRLYRATKLLQFMWKKFSLFRMTKNINSHWVQCDLDDEVKRIWQRSLN